MSEPPVKRSWLARLSPQARAALGVIIIIVISYFVLRYAPPEGESNNVTGDAAETPTVSINNLVDTLTVNRQFDYQGAHVTITRAMEATNFSDDRRVGGAYTVRVLVNIRNTGKLPLGVDYVPIIRLMLADGQAITPKRLSIKPVLLPSEPQSGYIDFPIATQVSLSSLTLHFGAGITIPFGP